MEKQDNLVTIICSYCSDEVDCKLWNSILYFSWLSSSIWTEFSVQLSSVVLLYLTPTFISLLPFRFIIPLLWTSSTFLVILSCSLFALLPVSHFSSYHFTYWPYNPTSLSLVLDHLALFSMTVYSVAYFHSFQTAKTVIFVCVYRMLCILKYWFILIFLNTYAILTNFYFLAPLENWHRWKLYTSTFINIHLN